MATGQPIRLTAAIKADPERLIHPDDVAAAMQTTLQLLAESGIGPAQTITIVVMLPNEIEAFDLRGKVRAALVKRPMGIDAKLKIETVESVHRDTVPATTPMDEYIDDDEADDQPGAARRRAQSQAPGAITRAARR